MNNRHKRTLAAIFAKPVPAGLKWSDIEKLLKALGAEITEGSGSRVRILLNEKRAVFHRPHPEPETDKGAVVAVREFLKSANIKP